jgi:hypothetical protein
MKTIQIENKCKEETKIQADNERIRSNHQNQFSYSPKKSDMN